MNWEWLWTGNGWGLAFVVLAVLAIYELNDIARRLGRIDQAIRGRHGQE